MHAFTRNSFGDQYIHEVNGNSLNKLGAFQTISNRLGAGLQEEEYIYIVIGTDSGQIPNYLLEKGVPAGSEYLFIETNELFPTIQSIFPSHPQLHLCRPEEWINLADQLKLTLHIQAHSARQIDSIALGVGFHIPYIDLTAQIKRDFNFYINSALKHAELYEFFKIGLKNLADNQHSITSIIGDHDNDTAIILGAGPSLDQHIDWIRENQDRLYIFTVSRLSGKLATAGITPDFIVTVDSHEVSYEFGRDSFQFENDATLIHSFHANSQLLGQWLGNKVFTGKRYPWKSKRNEDCIDQGGTTVTNIAYDAAITIGFKQILLAGVDFCHDTRGFTHAKGTGNAITCTPLLDSSSDFHVTNNRNEQANTTAEFKEAGNDFSIRAQGALNHGVETTNLSGSAMQIKGVAYQEREQIKLRQNNIKSPLNIAGTSSTTFLKNCLTELNSSRNKLKKLATLAQEVIQNNRVLFDRYGEKDAKKERQLIKTEQKLDGDKNPFVPLIKVIGLRQSLRHLRATRSEERDWSHEEITESKVAYYQEFLRNTNRLITDIDDSIKRVKIRQLEAAPTVNTLLPLLTQWEQDRHPRRLQLLAETGLLETPSPEVSARLESITSLQHTIDSQTIYPSNLSEIKIKEAFTNIVSHTSKLDLKGLIDLQEKLSLQYDAPNKQAYIQLCSGLIAYLKGEKRVALDNLAHLLTEEKARHFDENQIEYILTRVSMFALETKDLPKALSALDKLSNTCSDYYTPKYAELLYLMGDTDKALTTYEHYISHYPDDLDTVFSLAELQRKEGLIESAGTLYQFILSRNPNYQPAIHRMAQL